MTDRQQIAAQQEALVRSLLAGGPVPPGFDVDRVRTQSEALIAKRRRAVERAVPDLTTDPAFVVRFGQWARANPPRPGSCAHADASAFAAEAAQPVTDQVRKRSRRSWTARRTAGSRSARP